MGTDTAGFLLRPSMMSGALSPYILWMALRWMTSEEPPIVLSSLNRSCSSADMRESLFCTVSRALIVARLFSNTMSSCREYSENTFALLKVSSCPWLPGHQIEQKKRCFPCFFPKLQLQISKPFIVILCDSTIQSIAYPQNAIYGEKHNLNTQSLK